MTTGASPRPPEKSGVSGRPSVADFASLLVGDHVSLRLEYTAAEVEAFARLSGDFNPLHLDDEFARRTRFRRRIVHGMLSAAYVSRLVGMGLPGPGALWLEQSFNFVAPIFVGDEIELRLWVEHKSEATRTVVVRVEARNRQKAVVLRGQGKVMVLAVEGQPASAAGVGMA